MCVLVLLLSVFIVSIRDLFSRSINKDQFEKKKNDTLDPEMYVLLVTSVSIYACLLYR